MASLAKLYKEDHEPDKAAATYRRLLEMLEGQVRPPPRARISSAVGAEPVCWAQSPEVALCDAGSDALLFLGAPPLLAQLLCATTASDRACWVVGVAAEYHMERGHFDDAEQHCKALLDRGAAQAKERAKALLCAPRPISFSLKTRSVFLLGGLTVLLWAGAISIPATTWSTRCRSAGTCDRGLAGHPMQLS